MRCRDGMVCSKILVNCLRTSGGCRPRGVCVPANANGQPSVRPSRSPDNNGNDDRELSLLFDKFIMYAF